MNLCGETLREINMFMEYFFSSDLENTFYSEIVKENLVRFRWAEDTQMQNEIPLFFTRGEQSNWVLETVNNLSRKEIKIYRVKFAKGILLWLNHPRC